MRRQCDRCGAWYDRGSHDPDICPDCVEILAYLARVDMLEDLWECDDEEEYHA